MHASAGGGRLHGLVPQPLPRKPDFVLTDTSGHLFSFTKRTGNKLTYLYFGYTHCPHVCLSTFFDLAAALRTQTRSVRRRVEVVFVTVDPGRDTPRVMRAWLDHFNHTFVGLTGSPRSIRAAERSVGVPPASIQKRKEAYSLAHSSLLFAFSPDNLSHVVYVQGFKTPDYADDMPVLLRYGKCSRLAGNRARKSCPA